MLERLVDGVHVPAQGVTDGGPQEGVYLPRDELDLRPGEAVEGGDPLLYLQEVVRVAWVGGECDRNVRRVGIRKGVAEALGEAGETGARFRRGHGDGEVAPVVGPGKKGLRQPVLDPVARTGAVLRPQGTAVGEGVVAN